MKKIKISMIIAIMFCSCSSIHYAFVQEPDKNEFNIKKYCDITFNVFNTLIAFTLVNKSDQLIEINWGRSAFIDEDNFTHRLIHKGTRLIERDKKQENSIVHAGTTLNESIYPIDKISGPSWTFEPLFPVPGLFNSHKAEDQYGETIKIILAVIIDNKEYFLKYSFVVEEAPGSPEEVQEY